jgi:hypothetical protein
MNQRAERYQSGRTSAVDEGHTSCTTTSQMAMSYELTSEKHERPVSQVQLIICTSAFELHIAAPEQQTSQNTVTVIKSSRMRWADHVVRMYDNELPKKILWTNPAGQRRRGRPKSRWIGGIEEDTRKLGCRNWWADAQDRGRWRHFA